MLVLGGYFRTYVENALKVRSIQAEGYASHSSASNRSDSLGMKLIINQPLPVRLILGSGSLAINPIPLWANFRWGVSEYNILKGFHGLFQIILMPYVILSIYICGRMFILRRIEGMAMLYLAIFYILNVAAVAVTSLETRHAGQFISAFIILAAAPNMKEPTTRRLMRVAMVGWFSLVVLVHLLWIIMRGIG
tara:strand:+ start:99 stop:674 length:576 start_codon:yes stop_codon:yes gene_type:complete